MFSVKTAYEVQMDKETPIASFWNQLWGLTSPRNARVFLWRVLHESLPTADWLIFRSLGSSAAGFGCGACVEDISHALRDCRPAKTILVTM
ncbi:Reverse transcriptase zinc-binding domain - like 1 [Theobroma cacao]|nr:Reverse transcriptase zinc-binding domain - like 1 [Theobroma cacao]